MANVKVSAKPADIKLVGQAIQGSATNYISEMKKVYDTVEFLQSSWTGDAANQFVTKINSFKQEYADFGTLIKSFGDLLIDVSNAYSEVEKKLTF